MSEPCEEIGLSFKGFQLSVLSWDESWDFLSLEERKKSATRLQEEVFLLKCSSSSNGWTFLAVSRLLASCQVSLWALKKHKVRERNLKIPTARCSQPFNPTSLNDSAASQSLTEWDSQETQLTSETRIKFNFSYDTSVFLVLLIPTRLGWKEICELNANDFMIRAEQAGILIKNWKSLILGVVAGEEKKNFQFKVEN